MRAATSPWKTAAINRSGTEIHVTRLSCVKPAPSCVTSVKNNRVRFFSIFICVAPRKFRVVSAAKPMNIWPGFLLLRRLARCRAWAQTGAGTPASRFLIFCVDQPAKKNRRADSGDINVTSPARVVYQTFAACWSASRRCTDAGVLRIIGPTSPPRKAASAAVPIL